MRDPVAEGSTWGRWNGEDAIGEDGAGVDHSGPSSILGCPLALPIRHRVEVSLQFPVIGLDAVRHEEHRVEFPHRLGVLDHVLADEFLDGHLAAGHAVTERDRNRR